MPEKPPNTGRASSDPTELERAVGACRSAFTVCAVFSLAINLLMLVSPIYMLQVYDRVLTTGRVETLLMLTLIATIALVVMCALDALRTSITIRVGCWLNEQLGPAYLACAVRGRLQGDLSGAEPLRDISQIQTFIATQGLTAFFDAPWVPIFVALIWILHPMLGLVAVSSAVVLFLLSIVNEKATRKANETANRKQTEAMLLADATIRNAEIVQAMHMLPALTERWAAVNRTVLDGMRRSGDVGGLVPPVVEARSTVTAT
jgi:ATP-binding cassette subfamily C protein/ATP-binding cassette subfamily C exporter for protease/lipase/ATP-binding cassette subfamily C protein EexD